MTVVSRDYRWQRRAYEPGSPTRLEPRLPILPDHPSDVSDPHWHVRAHEPLPRSGRK